MAKYLTPPACREHFVIKNGNLYKRLKDGTARRISTLKQGRLKTVLYGEDYFGVDLAWTLYYGTVPAFPVFVLDGDPFNLAQENLVAARIKRLRFRYKAVRGGFRHSLSKHVVFNSLDRCHADWIEQARRYYSADFANIRAWEDEYLQDQNPADYVRPVRPSTAAGRVSAGERPTPPQFRAGFKHYWHADQWVVVPEACHPADDYMERCRKTLAGAVSFKFNEGTEMVEGFDAAGALVE